MKGSTILVTLLLFVSMSSGCMDDSGESIELEFKDDSGNEIQKKGGDWSFVDSDGTRIGLSGSVNIMTPTQLVQGEVNVLSIEGSGTIAMVLPNFTFPVIEGKIVNETIIVVSLPSELHLLVAPSLNVSSWRTATMITVYGSDKGEYVIGVGERETGIISGQYWYDLLERVTDDIDGYNGRYVGEGSPQLERAATFFQETFEGFGLEAEIVRYPISPDVQVLNVVAYHWGTNRDDWIVIGGHYDVAPPPSGLGTWEGAYDNTAGSTAVVTLARALSQHETNKTIVFGLWSSEEEGLHGSDEFVENLPPEVTVHANINLDMIGLAYPSPGKKVNGLTFPNENGTVIEHPHFIWYMNHTIHDVLRLPRDIEQFHVKEGGTSGSDHTPFWQAGIPAVFFISGPVSNYHTPGDTLENLIQDAGSVELLIAGFDTCLWIAYLTTIFLDGDGYVHP